MISLFILFAARPDIPPAVLARTHSTYYGVDLPTVFNPFWEWRMDVERARRWPNYEKPYTAFMYVVAISTTAAALAALYILSLRS